VGDFVISSIHTHRDVCGVVRVYVYDNLITFFAFRRHGDSFGQVEDNLFAVYPKCLERSRS